MKVENLLSVSPLDGRYNEKILDLRDITSEFGLIKFRVIVEIKWFIHLSKQSKIKELPRLSIKENSYLIDLIQNFSLKDARRIKKIERKTNHDVKAVEYFLREQFLQFGKLGKYSEFIHFACTSEDINNLSYALMISEASKISVQSAKEIDKKIKVLSRRFSKDSMVSRTHGQSASPTTMGKEFSNVSHRVNKILDEIKRNRMTCHSIAFYLI